MAKFTKGPGRAIERFGVPVAYVGRVGSDATGYVLAPWEADTLADQIVAALNAADPGFPVRFITTTLSRGGRIPHLENLLARAQGVCAAHAANNPGRAANIGINIVYSRTLRRYAARCMVGTDQGTYTFATVTINDAGS